MGVLESKRAKQAVGFIFGLVLGFLALGVVIFLHSYHRHLRPSKTFEAEQITKAMAQKVEAHHGIHCSPPPPMPRHADLSECIGGEKCEPTAELPPFWAESEFFEDDLYFVYSFVPSEKYAGAMEIRAEADFNPATTEHHIVTRSVRFAPGCEIEIAPAFTENEFE